MEIDRLTGSYSRWVSVAPGVAKDAARLQPADPDLAAFSRPLSGERVVRTRLPTDWNTLSFLASSRPAKCATGLRYRAVNHYARVDIRGKTCHA